MSIGVHVVALSLDFTMSKFLCAIFIQVSNEICTVVFVVIVCYFVCACILCTILGHRRRRGQADSRGFIAGLGHYSRAPHNAVIRLWPLLPVEWMDALRPCGDGVSIGVVMLGNRGTIVMWGIASINFGSTYTKNDYLGKKALSPAPRGVGCVCDVRWVGLANPVEWSWAVTLGL